jgi:hypothetical protein
MVLDEYDAYTVTTVHAVRPEAVSRFATAVSLTDPAYHRPLDPVAPPTFPIAFIIETQEKILASPELRFDYSRVVHREQHFTYQRPIRGGEEVSVTISLQSIDPLQGNAIATFTVDLAVAGEIVGTAKAVLVSRAPVTA